VNWNVLSFFILTRMNLLGWGSGNWSMSLALRRPFSSIMLGNLSMMLNRRWFSTNIVEFARSTEYLRCACRNSWLNFLLQTQILLMLFVTFFVKSTHTSITSKKSIFPTIHVSLCLGRCTFFSTFLIRNTRGTLFSICTYPILKKLERYKC
jgi:hypothetical protein